MATRAELLHAYDTQLRGVAETAGALSWDRVGPLWRAIHRHDEELQGFVSHEELAGHDVPRLVAATAAWFRDETGVASFEWKTRGHDSGAAGLDAALRAHGLAPGEPETVMVGEATALAVDVRLDEGLSVRRLDDAPDAAALLAEASDVQRRVFGRGGDLAQRVAAAGRCEVWAALDGERVVSVGRLEVVDDTGFAGLWGGATLGGHRGRGLYRALTAARARAALARGVRLLQVDCSPMSRPILERSGLVAVTTTTPYEWTRPG
ncbi:GNAT family N-acetyltransferase [Nocardioides dongxiaopingii]|uniref:GNAT family N-acetyltransferase n=1 Tax=Nocardioides sp. S-1144 TaxID=2582905 RepID=UPI00110E2875|nr:GNAT family N-acetyltransferase [Nocardioides sp. S-1144]QCW50311.1 GNAT family N-acetyltransferase [Nocardioides sp. S-1144]